MLSDLTEKELNSAVEVYRHAYGDTISEAEAFEEMCCDALGKINIFAGTEHDSANYGKVQESFRKHTAETANKGRAPPKGKTKKYSLEPVEAVQPTSGEWERGSTTEEVREVHPQLWAVDAESSETRNPTQISGTVKSYRKIYDALDAEGFNGTILDASSGLGYGTRAGREEYGFNVDDIEPFPDSSYKPKYTDYSKLNKKYDVIISNAVLNVLPQDQRDALVVKMGKMLNDGGKMFINVRGTDVKNASSKVAIDEANMEYYISNTGSYQKGFTKRELIAYLSDALGSDYTITPSSKFGAVSVVVTKKPSSAVKYSRQQAYWKPKLNNAEWNLLNNSTAVEIGSKSKFLDEATKWLYAKKKGAEVFALYGIGDGTVPTVLYASGVEKAASDLARFTSFLKEYDYGTVTYAKTAVRWAEIVSSIKRSMYGDYDAYGHRRKTLELDGILAEASKRLGRRDNDTSAKDNDGVNYSREPESITELRRQNERLHIDAEKAVTLYGNARVIMPKILHSRNGFIASIRDASSPVKPHL